MESETRNVALARTIEEYGLDRSRFDVIAPGPQKRADKKRVGAHVSKAIGPLLEQRGFGAPKDGIHHRVVGSEVHVVEVEVRATYWGREQKGLDVFVWLGCFARGAHPKHAAVVPKSHVDCELRGHLWKRREQVEMTAAVDTVEAHPRAWLIDEDCAYLPWVTEEILACVEADALPWFEDKLSSPLAARARACKTDEEIARLSALPMRDDERYRWPCYPWAHEIAPLVASFGHEIPLGIIATTPQARHIARVLLDTLLAEPAVARANLDLLAQLGAVAEGRDEAVLRIFRDALEQPELHDVGRAMMDLGPRATPLLEEIVKRLDKSKDVRGLLWTLQCMGAAAAPAADALRSMSGDRAYGDHQFALHAIKSVLGRRCTMMYPCACCDRG